VGGISTWTGVYNEHNADCATCHNFTVDATGDPGTPGVGTVQTVITTDATANCTTCHELKLWSNAASSHGGHDATAFNTDVPACTGCHTIGAEGTVASIHNDTCTLCHASDAGGYGTLVAPDATNGADGDARNAQTGAPSYKDFTCLTCHDIARIIQRR
jgi:hypothetical protein